MKKQKLICAVGLSLLLVACGGNPREVALLRPVKIAEVESLGTIDKSFSGVVMPDQYSDLAFKVGGPLIALKVVEGTHVRKGDIIAQVDPLDYRLAYEAKKSSYLTAKSQLERAEKLLARDATSHQDYESTRASFDNAKSAFESAESQLEETKLRAPFSGFIQTKYVENYQKVQPGTPIVCLINPDQLQIRFTMPESNLDYLLDNPELLVEFENYKGVQFKTKIKEYVPASTDGSGVPVFLHVADPRFNLKDYNVAVGFTCRVVLRHRNSGMANAMVVPMSAVFPVSGSDGEFVYVFNSQDSLVKQREVKTGGLFGRDKTIIAEGVTPGEQVVIAGTTRLVDGQKVKVLSK